MELIYVPVKNTPKLLLVQCSEGVFSHKSTLLKVYGSQWLLFERDRLQGKTRLERTFQSSKCQEKSEQTPRWIFLPSLTHCAVNVWDPFFGTWNYSFGAALPRHSLAKKGHQWQFWTLHGCSVATLLFEWCAPNKQVWIRRTLSCERRNNQSLHVILDISLSSEFVSCQFFTFHNGNIELSMAEYGFCQTIFDSIFTHRARHMQSASHWETSPWSPRIQENDCQWWNFLTWAQKLEKVSALFRFMFSKGKLWIIEQPLVLVFEWGPCVLTPKDNTTEST